MARQGVNWPYKTSIHQLIQNNANMRQGKRCSATTKPKVVQSDWGGTSSSVQCTWVPLLQHQCGLSGNSRTISRGGSRRGSRGGGGAHTGGGQWFWVYLLSQFLRGLNWSVPTSQLAELLSAPGRSPVDLAHGRLGPPPDPVDLAQPVDLAHLIYFGFAIYLYFLLSIPKYYNTKRFWTIFGTENKRVKTVPTARLTSLCFCF